MEDTVAGFDPFKVNFAPHRTPTTGRAVALVHWRLAARDLFHLCGFRRWMGGYRFNSRHNCFVHRGVRGATAALGASVK